MLRKGTDSDKLWEKEFIQAVQLFNQWHHHPFFSPVPFWQRLSTTSCFLFSPSHSLPPSVFSPSAPPQSKHAAQLRSSRKPQSLYLISTSHTYVYKERVEALKAHTRSWWSFIWSSKVQKRGIPPKLHIEPLKDEIVTCEKASIHDMVGDSWSKVSATVLLQWQR